MTTVAVKGSDIFDEDMRAAYLEKINKLSTTALKNLSQLAENKKGIDYLENDFEMIKSFLM